MAKKPSRQEPTEPNFISETGYENSQLDFFNLFKLDTLQIDGKTRWTRALALYDALPKFVFTADKDKKKDSIKASESVNKTIKFGDQVWNFNLHPAQVAANSKTKADAFFAYPGEREELIARALRFLSVNGSVPTSYWVDQNEKPLPPQARVKFTLGELQRLLNGWGHTFSYAELDEGLSILLRSHITVTVQGDTQATYNGPILLDSFSIDRGDNSARAVALNTLEVEAIRGGSYRAVRINRLMTLESPLARRLYEYIMLHHLGAEKPKPDQPPRPFKIRLSTIISECCIEQAANMTNTINRIRKAFDNLRKQGILSSEFDYTEEKQFQPAQGKGGRPSIKEVIWSLYLSADTAKDIIAANVEAWPATEDGKRILGSPKHVSIRRQEAKRANLK